MKIVFISYHYWPPKFGGELLVSIERFHELVKRGHQVTVLTAGEPGFLGHEVREGIEIYRSPKVHNSRSGRGFRRLFFPIWVNSILRKLPVDVVHILSTGGLEPFSASYGGILINNTAHNKGASTVYVHSLADTDQQAFSNQETVFRLRNLFLKQVDAIVSVSPMLYQGVLKVFPAQAELISCGVRDDIFKKISDKEREKCRYEMGVGPNELVFCFLGTVGKRKGFDLLAQAFADLLVSNPDWRLWVIGPRTVQENQNIDPIEVKKVCAPLEGLDYQVRYLGRVNDRSRLAILLGASDIFTFPSLREGFGLAPVEAMAAGTPVIVSRLPGVTDMANVEGETGLFVEPGDVISLKKAMFQMATRPDLRAQMGTAAAQRVHDHFGWQQHVTHWENLYKRLSGTSRQ